MAIKFKSKYTAQQIEQILDNINATNQGSFVKVDELPDPNDAATNQFYLLDNQIWYVNTDKDPREWEALAAAGGGGGSVGDDVIDASEWDEIELNMFDFAEDETDESYFFVLNETPTKHCLDEIKATISENQKTYYKIAGIKGAGWLETPVADGNEIVSVQGSYYTSESTINFFVQLTLVDGTQVKLTLDNEATGRYSINYIGFAL